MENKHINKDSVMYSEPLFIHNDTFLTEHYSHCRSMTHQFIELGHFLKFISIYSESHNDSDPNVMELHFEQSG